jgi:hypothetical protein
MDTFSFDPRAWRVLCLVRRNPLVRRSDRLEMLVITLAAVVSLLAMPFVAAMATDAYQTDRNVYAAVGVASLGEGLAVTIAAAVVIATRWQVGRIRSARWDRELSSVLGSRGGGRSR